MMLMPVFRNSVAIAATSYYFGLTRFYISNSDAVGEFRMEQE
jgi:hypothetical protein